MRSFTLVDFQYWALAFFLGLTALLFVFIAWGTYPRRRKERAEQEIEKMADQDITATHEGEKNPVPLFLVLVYVFITLWALGYMVFVGIRGTNI